MRKDAIKLTFTHRVTRDELIESLDRVLNFYGCISCGLNGWDGIYLLGDPDPGIRQLKEELFKENLETLVDVEHFQAPIQQLNQASKVDQH